MKMAMFVLLSVLTVACVNKKKETPPISEYTDVPRCSENALVISQTNFSGGTVLVASAPGNEIVQAYKMDCDLGLLKSISIRMNCYDTGFTCSAKLGLYEGGTAENLNSLIEEVSIYSIADTTSQFYTATFTHNIVMMSNQTYWIKLTNTGSKSISVLDSGSVDAYSNGDLWSYYMSGLTKQTDHKDLAFKVQLH
jgi:hypothetical protein